MVFEFEVLFWASSACRNVRNQLEKSLVFRVKYFPFLCSLSWQFRTQVIVEVQNFTSNIFFLSIKF